MKNHSKVLSTALLIILCSINFFGFEPYLGLISKTVTVIVIIGLQFSFLRQKKSNYYFKREVLLLMFLPFASVITSYIYWHQPILSTIQVTRGMFLWGFYFYLHKINIKPVTLIKCTTLVAVTFVVINLVQQFSYPRYVFFGLSDGGETYDIEIRNGLYRFRVEGVLYAFIPFFYFFSRIIKKFNIKYLSYMLICFAGIFVSLTRQYYAAAIIPLFFTPLFVKSTFHRRVIGVVFIGVLSLFGIYYLTPYLSSMVEMTQEHLNNEDYVRWLAYSFYLFEFWKGPMTVMFGNGMHLEGTAYGKIVREIYDNFKFIHSDIGIIGAMNRYGLVYLLINIFLYVKLIGLFKYIDLQYKLLVVASLITIMMVYWTRDPIFFSIILYLIEKSFKRNKYDRYKNRYDRNSHSQLQQ
jgi:hypothetical protein